MTLLLSDQTHQRQAELEAVGTSGSALAKTTALALVLSLLGQTGSGLAASRVRRFVESETLGTSAEPWSLKITEADLFSQINRIYDRLLKEQQDLDIDTRRILYGN